MIFRKYVNIDKFSEVGYTLFKWPSLAPIQTELQPDSIRVSGIRLDYHTIAIL